MSLEKSTMNHLKQRHAVSVRLHCIVCKRCRFDLFVCTGTGAVHRNQTILGMFGRSYVSAVLLVCCINSVLSVPTASNSLTLLPPAMLYQISFQRRSCKYSYLGEAIS